MTEKYTPADGQPVEPLDPSFWGPAPTRWTRTASWLRYYWHRIIRAAGYGKMKP